MSLEFSEYLGVWVVGTLAAISGVAVHLTIVDRMRRHRRVASLYRCEQCKRVYEDERNVPLSACPACGTLNEAIQR